MAAALQLTSHQILTAGCSLPFDCHQDLSATSASASPCCARSGRGRFQDLPSAQHHHSRTQRVGPTGTAGHWEAARWQRRLVCKASESTSESPEGEGLPEGSDSAAPKKRSAKRAGRKPKGAGLEGGEALAAEGEAIGGGAESEGDGAGEAPASRRGRGGRRRAAGARASGGGESGSESEPEPPRAARTAVEDRERGLLTGTQAASGEGAEGGGGGGKSGGGILTLQEKGVLVKGAAGGGVSAEAEAEEEAEEEEEGGGEAGAWGEEGKFGWPPLIVCMGEALSEFVPSVRPNPDERQDDPEVISSWKAVQWSPPEFARIPGGPVSNVAIALGRLSARVGFLGRLGEDGEGRRMAELMRTNGVMVDGVTFDPDRRTGVARMALKVEKGGKMELTCAVPSADAALSEENVDQELLEEARILHVTAMSLLTEPSRATVIANVRRAKKRGTRVVLDVNLPLYLWSSQAEALKILRPIWLQADVIKVSCVEFEFLVNEAYFERKRIGAKLYAAENEQAGRAMGDPFHYDLREVLPVLSENVKLILVTNGTWSVHYYSPDFNGFVVGTEDVLVSAYHCDRTGSGDAIMAAFLRKLSIHPEILHDEDRLRRAIRFAISAGIVTQWTQGAVRSFPTEDAVQNMTEQVYNIANVYM